MHRKRVKLKALIVGTKVATDSHESGASLRLLFQKNLLEGLGYEVTTLSKDLARATIKRINFDLILISSYSCSSIAGLARRHTPILWFDPCDSWFSSRLSMLRGGYLLSLILLFRDLFYLSNFPKRDITTFISRKDSLQHPRFLKNDNLFIIPIDFPNYEVKNSETTSFIFIGDGDFAPNRRALKFLQKVAKLAEVQIKVIGKGYKRQNRLKNCIFLDYLPSTELYSSKDVHLVPITYGAGIKTKAAIPLSLGLRVIANPHSTNGLVTSKNLLVASSVVEFATIIKDILSDNSWSYIGITESVYVDDEVSELIEFLTLLSEERKVNNSYS